MGSRRQNHFKTLKQVPPQTKMSQGMSKELKQRGFNFVGPVIVYAFAQAVGMVNDHIVSCHRYELGRPGWRTSPAVPISDHSGVHPELRAPDGGNSALCTGDEPGGRIQLYARGAAVRRYDAGPAGAAHYH